jgi:hypothetical protein
MMDHQTVTCVGVSPDGPTYEAMCLQCGYKIFLRLGQVARCECGKEWQLQITAVTGQRFEIK